MAPSVPRFDVRRDLTVSLVCLANLDSCGFLRVCVFRCCFFWCVFLTARSDLIVTDRHRTVHAVLSSPSHVLHPTLQAAQSALLSQLDKEQENLQLEVQETRKECSLCARHDLGRLLKVFSFAAGSLQISNAVCHLDKHIKSEGFAQAKQSSSIHTTQNSMPQMHG